MKQQKILLLSLLMSIMALVLFALDIRTSTPVSFTDSYTLTVNSTHPNPFRLNSVIMAFPSAETNTLSVQLLRGTNDFGTILSDTGVYRTTTWIPIQGLNLNVGDSLIFSNTASVVTSLTYNYEI